MGRIFTIDPGLPFLDVLAAAIQRHWMTPDDPLKATDVTILLPTNRACRALRDAFLRVGDGQALLLPKILPLGETSQEDSEDPATLVSAPGTPGGGSSNQTDDPLAFTLPPPIGDLQRRFLLARLVAAKDPSLTEDQALRLAADLGGLLDRVQAERLSWDRLATLVPEGLSDHWQHALTFLTILAQIWPTLLAERHLSDPAQWRDALQRHRAGSWSHRPPGPVIAAGSTGSQPGTADLLATIAALPEGWVVLPGLDREMADEDWAALEDTHPQANLARLCQRLGTARQQVETLPGAPDPGPASTARRRLVAQALRPAATTDAWSRMPPTLPAALEGLTRLDAPSPREEATAIALMLRQTLDSPGRTAALITPDRPLARRVAAALDRWGVAVDDSAGQPLSSAIPGRLLILSATAALDGFGPLSLMALLRHPLVALGEDPSDFRDKVRLLDRTLLRGPRPADGLAELAALAEAAAEHRPALRPLGPWLQRLAACAAPFAALTQETRVDPSHFAETHMRFCEALADARIDGAMIPGALRLWTGDAGEAAARFATELAESLIETGSPDGIAPRRWPAVLEAAMEGRVVRPGRDLHSRLFIWGPLEARLQRPDLVVLGGLNEDTWPAAVDPGPWMSRPMMHSFGLPPPERRIGLAAHDFAQLIAAPEVVLSRAAKV
ncbi:MAG: double-strand break repair protein AddB, partial [Rhodospirillaceae bacterium]